MGGRRSKRGWDELGGGVSVGQMKVDERLLVLRSYFQRAPNPVRGLYGGALSWHCFPTGGLEAGEACGVVGDSPSSVHWAQTLINHLFRGY